MNVAYFTASVDKVATNKEFAASLELKYPILSDPSKKAAKAYGVVTESRTLPHRWTFIIIDGKIAAIDKKVSAGTHGRDVIAQLKELGVGAKKGG